MTSRDETFRTFTPEQAAAYAEGRGGAYPSPIYESIMNYHTGSRTLVLDVGTGPGKAVWDLVAYFDKAVGSDVSPEMISQARKDAVVKGLEGRVRFGVCGGEDCTSVLESHEVGMVDVITVAMAAHWLDLPQFYEQAAKCLKPGGTLAMFTCSSTYIHPSTPRHEEIQAILFDLENGMLGPYMKPGNALARNAYNDLPLPWSQATAAAECSFDSSSFERFDWDRNGVPSSPPLPDGTPGPFIFGDSISLRNVEAAFGSASPVVRWREAHPGKALGAEDPVNITVRRLREIIGDGEEGLLLGPSCSLLVMRKRG